MSNLIQKHPFYLVNQIIVTNKCFHASSFHTTSVQQSDEINKLRVVVRWETGERLNLEHDPKIILMADKYVKSSNIEVKLILRKPIAIMFDRLVRETGAPKSVVLIILAIMAQTGGSYYQTVMRNRLDDEFYYKEFHLSIRQVLNALTEGLTFGHIFYYSDLQCQNRWYNPSVIKTKPSLFRVFVQLQDIIYYIAYLAKLEGDLFPRYLKDNNNRFPYSCKENPLSYVWYSSFQLDNPRCPLEIREWLKANRRRFMINPKYHRISGPPKKNKS